MAERVMAVLLVPYIISNIRPKDFGRIIINNKAIIMHPAIGCSLAIDLTFATPCLSLYYTWKPLDDLHCTWK